MKAFRKVEEMRCLLTHRRNYDRMWTWRRWLRRRRRNKWVGVVLVVVIED
jgi:hypothetical protein